MHRCTLLAVVFVNLGILDMLGMAAVASASAQTPQSEISGCRVSDLAGATQDALSKDVVPQAGDRADRLSASSPR
jgi:hypothetical protein